MTRRDTDKDTKRIIGDTTKVRLAASSARLRDLSEMRTRKVTLEKLPAEDIEKLFGRIHGYNLNAGKLHEARNFDELFAAATAAVGALFDLRYHQFLFKGRDGRLQPRGDGTAPPQKTGTSDSYEDLVEWALQARQVLFYDVEDVGLENVNTIGIVPIIDEDSRQGVLLIWLSEPISKMNVLQDDMLQAFSRDLRARSLGLIQSERHARLSSLFDNIIESVPHAIVAIGGDDKVIALNANAEFLFGIKRIFVIDEPYKEAFPAAVVKTFDNLIQQTLMGRVFVDGEIEHTLEAGVTVNIGVSVSFLRDRQGKPQGHLFLCRDLSLSREVQKLRELDQMKSEFVNTVSHELKTPLTAILGGLEVIEADAETLPEDVRDLLKVVGDAAQRLRNLIFDLLDVSRLESGRVQLKEQLTSIRDIVTEALRVQSPKASHKIELDIPADVKPVMMDRAKLIQCLTNYVSNAIKYSPNGGIVRIAARRDEAKRKLVVSVSDQGVGIPPQHIGKIFQKFYRVDASYTSEIEGTGLGLVIVKHIVELHGGNVWVESQAGKGSSFFLTLPLRETADAQ